MTQFTDLDLVEPILRALAREGYATPTPIQAQSIPHLLDGRDLLGIAQTGTGKTAAFALPILQHLINDKTRAPSRGFRALIMAPTRELAAQIADSFRAYGQNLRLSIAVVVGGAKHGPQIKALARGVDVLVATPGRLIDHLESGNARLDSTRIVVLDEADHMLDLGFLVPIRRILKGLPAERQGIFFSATMPDPIGKLAGEMLRNPVRVAVAPVAATADRVEQQVMLVESSRKRDLLAEISAKPEVTRALVFTRTKHGADKVRSHLEASGIAAAAIHGNKSQPQRERALAAFKSGRTRILVATDIAARGIDVDGVSHVVNFDLPNVPESYVHRIGRTARAGAEGIAISFCDETERGFLRDIERLVRQRLPVVDRRERRDGAAAPAQAARPQRREQAPAPAHRGPARHGNGQGYASRRRAA
ncbi:MAG: DEAD/DEAH box helicase [Geminicoccaceae bacterium]|nr:DEAD/DEAH box helicase [Geminicoccaceae bacterium]